jgi:hypothetical protein
VVKEPDQRRLAVSHAECAECALLSELRSPIAVFRFQLPGGIKIKIKKSAVRPIREIRVIRGKRAGSAQISGFAIQNPKWKESLLGVVPSASVVLS